MNKNNLIDIEKLINKKKINEAQVELSKMGSEYHKNPEYLYLRSKIFYLNKLYYIALDTLLIALEFQQSDKIYNLIAEIYDVLENKELSKKILDSNSRLDAMNSIKDMDLFLLFDYTGPSAVKRLPTEVQEAAYMTDQSDSWVAISVFGAKARSTLQRTCPVDLHPTTFHTGKVIRTVMNHISTVILCVTPNSFLLLSPRSSSKSS